MNEKGKWCKSITAPAVTNKALIFIGNMEEAITFVDRQKYEITSSSEAGFTKNATLVRCIERFDVLPTDADAYIHGYFDLLAKPEEVPRRNRKYIDK